MVISDFSVRRPVVAIVASLMLCVFGLYSLTQMPVRETPNVDRPVVSVNVNYPGAAAEVVETRVVKLLEDQISGIAGIKSITAFARDGNGWLNIEFTESRSIDLATNDVRDQVSKVLSRLPRDADPPSISKADPDAEPILFVSLTSSKRSPLDLTEYGMLTAGPQLTTIDGVANVWYGGARKKAMRLWLDRRAMAARGLTETDVETALLKENLELGAGILESKDRFFTMRTVRSFQTPAQFAQLVVARGPNNYLVRLGEVANVELGAVDPYSQSRINGRVSLSIGVVKQPGASTIDVAKRIRTAIENMKRTAPSDIEFSIHSDNSVFISQALHEVSIAGGIAAILVMAVIYLFLGTFRAALIPAVAVPISLIGAAIVMWASGFSINILTLLAMVMAIGLVVDDAIIMLENIHRHMQMGEPPLLAAKRGARQVGMAVVSTTLVLASVFMPVALLRGTVGSLFREFAMSLAIMVLFSLFVSLTLTPVMCSKILKAEFDHSPVSQWTENAFARFTAFYRRNLERALDHSRFVMAGFVGVLVVCVGLFALLPQEFTPREDRGSFNIQVRPPEGASADYTARQVNAIYEGLKQHLETGEVVTLMENVQSPVGGGGGGGNVYVGMADWDNRKRSVQTFSQSLIPLFQNIPGAQIASNLPAALGLNGGGYGNVQMVVGGPTYDELRKWRDLLMDGLQGNPKFLQVRNNFVETKPQVKVVIDQARAGDLGVSMQTIGQTLAGMMGSRRVTTFFDQGEEYDVMIQGQTEDRRTPNDVSNIYVRSDTTKQLVPLSNVVKLEEAGAAASFNRYNRHRSFMLNVYPRTDVPLADVIAELERVVAERLPSTAEINWRGEAGDYKDNSMAIYFTFGLALVVAFLVLAAQFESFVHPMVVMMTVPLATAGALAGLLLFGQSINLYSQIGMIVLVGLAAKNGILIVEFANQLRDEGREFREALIEASLTRLRPIVMTALATVMGALPLIIATGAGSEGRRPIGVVIFAGVSFATLITLFVIPTFYMLFARRTSSPGQLAEEIRAQEAAFGAKIASEQPAE